MTVLSRGPMVRTVPRQRVPDDEVRPPDRGHRRGPSPRALTAAARRLLETLRTAPDGSVSPSVYETGRVVSLAPWLPGQAERVAWLVRQQQADGRWGGPGGYGLVPTLSAVEALLDTAHRLAAGQRLGTLGGGRSGATDRELAGHGAVTRAAARGLAALRRSLRVGLRDLPDMPAIELIAPVLIEAVNAHLAAEPSWAGGARPLPTPRVLNSSRLTALRAAVAAGHPVPEKVVHALEVLGGHARRAAGVTPIGGLVGASPAATAAWLGRTAPRSGPVRSALTNLVARTGGPVPCGLPITAFERSWVLGELGRGGLLPATRARDIVTALAADVRPDGVPGGPGLPADADTTSATLYALALAGRAQPVDSLWRFQTPTHFCTWPGEDGSSSTVNAHVLEALTTAPITPQVRTAIARTRSWLMAQQSTDGFWLDRWHASPYYATRCCVQALHTAAGPSRSTGRESIRRAARWVLDTQREDGSWGLWTGTAEETAYAVMILVAAGVPTRATRRAISRGHRYLLARLAGPQPPAGLSTGDPDLGDDPAMWHDKDLYRPDAIVRAAVLAALRMAADHMVDPTG